MDGLIKWDDVERRIDTASDLKTIVAMQEQMEAMKVIAKQIDGSVKTANKVSKYRFFLEQKAGELYLGMPSERGDRPHDEKDSSTGLTNLSSKQEAIDEVGKSREIMNRWGKEADIERGVIEEFEAKCNEEGSEFTSSGVVRFAAGALVDNNSGDNEWYTPAEYIAAAKATMGGIDLDPCSTEEANSVVGAKVFFTAKDDGLSREWSGRVWMNPPYAQPLVRLFCEKMASSKITQAIILVNNATDTDWWQGIASHTSSICFPNGRVKFWHPRKQAVPLQGQTILYIGKNVEKFGKAFEGFGICLSKI